MQRALTAAVFCLAACGSTSGAVTPQPPPGAHVVVFEGTCDASGAVALDDRLFVVADDENNVLRVYDAERGGAPLGGYDVSRALDLPMKGKKRPHAAEMDLEEATRMGDRAYWVSSQGRSSRGKVRAERLKFFATTLPGGATGADGSTVVTGSIELVGQAYDGLLADLVANESLASLGLAEAAARKPKAPGGLNIEGLTATPDGHLLVGFRNPVPAGRALLVPLLNPEQLVTGAEPAARFGAPVRLDLGGRGVRSISWWHGGYLIVAGAPGAGGPSRLFTWKGGDDAPVEVDVDLAWMNPEGLFAPEGKGEVLLLSDDGGVKIGGKACKKLHGPARKQFRGVWIAPGR